LTPLRLGEVLVTSMAFDSMSYFALFTLDIDHIVA